MSARREKPRIALLLAAGLVFGAGFVAAAFSPSYGLFALCLAIIGISNQTLTTTTTAAVQLSTEPTMRGRVMAILLAVALGGTPLGAPFVGWIADRFGPRWALGAGAAAGFGAALVAARYLTKYRGLRLSVAGGRLRITLDEPLPDPAAER
jgi:MFS family permease